MSISSLESVYRSRSDHRGDRDLRDAAIELYFSRFVDIHKSALALQQLGSETLLVRLNGKLIERTNETD
jgi:hypothetical protein